MNDLNEFTNANEFKSYADLKKRLEYVLGVRNANKSQDFEVSNEETEDDDWKSTIKSEVAKEEKSYNTTSTYKDEDDSDDEDDALSYFQKLAET